MDDKWFEALVVILSLMMALFLFLAIILLVKFIQISNSIKRITEQAAQAVDKAEHIVEFFEKTATPVAVMKLIANISETLSKTASKFSKRKR